MCILVINHHQMLLIIWSPSHCATLHSSSVLSSYGMWASPLVTKTELFLCFSVDPFADATKGDDLLPAGTEDKIHIRIQQRNGRKTLTTVQGIADDYDKKKLVKAFKKVFSNFSYLKTFLPKCHLMLSNIALFYLIEICLQWYGDRAPRVWRGDSVTRGPKEEYLSVSDGGKVSLFGISYY